ncbi:MAG: carboxypeptidase-like regulatory domain-containing protein [Bacteroidota bacterium]
MNKSIISICILITLLFTQEVAAQRFATLTGKIIDVQTKEPLPFATVNVQNTPLGVVANQDGAFEFTFPSKYLADTIVFAIAGYQSEKLLAQKISGQDLTIELVEKAVVLTEVVVTNKELTAWQILELALKNIKNNYPTQPFEFDAFYRDYKIEDDKCIGIFEAAISVYDKGYSNVPNKYSFKEKVVLEQVRKSLAVEFRTHVFRRHNILKELLRCNDVRYQSRALDKKRGERHFTYEFDGYAIVNDRLMHKIKAKDEWEYHIYVDVVTYAIPRIEMNFAWEDVEDEVKWTLGDTIKYRQPASSLIMDFQMIDGLYYPKYSCFTADLQALDPTTEELLFTAYLRQEYMVTNIDFNPEEKPIKDSQMNPDLMVEHQKFTYDPAFWKNYNVIKLHPRDEKLIHGLEERVNLEEQFSAVQK